VRLTVTLEGVDKVLTRVTQIQRNLADLSTPLMRAGVYARDQAVLRIKNQGPGWVPNKRGGHTGIDTGRMWQSIGISQSNAQSITVGTNVFYARYFQDGTGTYAGHSAWTVQNSFGRKGFKTVHQGQPPRPFLYLNDIDREAIRAIFKRWMTGSQA
jgi:phage gpG-like protein